MASVALLVTNPDTIPGGGDDSTTPAFTPTAGSLMVGVVVARGTVINPGVFTTSDGMTFTTVQRSIWNAGSQTLFTYIADAVSVANSQTANWNCTGDSSTGAGVAVLEITGLDGVGLAAVVQTEEQNNGAAAATPQVVFAAAADAANPVIFVVGNAVNPPDLTAPSTFTGLVNIGFATPDTGLHVSYKNSGFTSDTITAGSASASVYAAQAVEFLAASAGVTGTAAQTLPSVTQAASGAETFSGTSAQTLPGVTQAASGTETIAGSAAQTLPAVTQAAAGTALVNATGTAAQILPSLRQEIVGVVTNPAVAEAAVTAPTLQGGAGRWAEAEFEGYRAQRRARLREVEARERERDKLKEKIAGETRRAASKKRQLPERATKLVKYDRQIAAADAAIAVALAEIARLETELAARTAMIADRRRRLMLVALTAA